MILESNFFNIHHFFIFLCRKQEEDKYKRDLQANKEKKDLIKTLKIEKEKNALNF